MEIGKFSWTKNITSGFRRHVYDISIYMRISPIYPKAPEATMCLLFFLVYRPIFNLEAQPADLFVKMLKDSINPTDVWNIGKYWLSTKDLRKSGDFC